jgi:lysophospholipase L1-like esterase
MRSAIRRGLAGAVAVGSLVALLGTASPASAATSITYEPLDYVALGDSYSAGAGVFPADPSASPLCIRSTRNFPHVIASATGARLKDVTCTAAETRHFYSSQYLGVAPQLNALRSDTDLVTLTIGGNDNNVFVGAIVACGTKGVLTFGFGSPCKNWFGSYWDNLVETRTYPAVKKALRDIHAKSPHAEVAILGYPDVLPPTGGCFAQMPIAYGDVPYVYNIQAHVNAVVRRAAAETGTTFVDMRASGRSACAPMTTRWVEPVLFGTNPVPVHPNAKGEAEMARRTMVALGL